MGKLVRDNIPKIIQDDGRIVSWRKLEKTELFEALRDKLLEEALEVKQASENTVVLEICDVLEVVDALLDFLNLSLIHISEPTRPY